MTVMTIIVMELLKIDPNENDYYLLVFCYVENEDLHKKFKEVAWQHKIN